jgi:hypothetical protein
MWSMVAMAGNVVVVAATVTAVEVGASVVAPTVPFAEGVEAGPAVVPLVVVA